MTPNQQSNDSRVHTETELIARYTADQVELQGTPTSLLQLAGSLPGTESAAHYSLRMPEGSASPYDGYLSAIQIMHTGGLTNIGQQADILVITGSPESLGILGENVRFAAEQGMTDHTPGLHSHIEYYPDNGFLAPDAIPLIVVCLPESSTAEESETDSN
jgi:hypothetical protein